MFRLIFIAFLSKCMLLLLPTFAFATGGVHCETKDQHASISIGMGRVPIYAPLNAWVSHGDKVWMDVPREDEIELGLSQGLIKNDTLTVDFVDVQASDIIISLFVDYSGDDEGEDGYKGTLSFITGESYTVYCLFE